MSLTLETDLRDCHECANAKAPFVFKTAYQPIVDLDHDKVFAYEALVRGPSGEGAATVLDQITDSNRYAFDQSSRRQAIENSVALGLLQTGAALSINFMPNAMYNPENCVRTSIIAAAAPACPTPA